MLRNLGSDVGLGLGAFALGSAAGAGAYGYPYGYGYGYGYGYYPPAAYYPPAPAYYAPRSCWDPYYRRYYACCVGDFWRSGAPLATAGLLSIV